MARTKQSTKTRNTQKQKVHKTTADKTEQEEQVSIDKTHTYDSSNLLTNCTSLRDTNESFIVSDITCKDNSLMQTSLLDYATKTTKNERGNIEQEVNDNTLNLMDENTNVNDNKSPILIIDTSNPKNIYRDFVALKMPIGQFISELPDLHQKQVKKLCIITMNKAVKMDDLLKMTTEKDRNTRLLATTCALHKIKTSYATKSKIDFADTFYNIVEARMRDISHNIRAVCFEYLFDICKHIDLKVKYINHGLDDKSDVVRKNTIKGLQQYIAKKNIPSIKAKIIQLCQYEKNDSNKKEACKLLLLMYSLQMVTSEEIFAVLDNFSEREMQDLYEHLKSQKNVIDVLHELNENALHKIKLNEEDMKVLLDCIKNDTQYLRILSAVVKANNCIIAELVDFLDIYTEDVENIKHIIKALTIIDTKYYTAEYEQVIEYLYDILLNYRDNAIYESIFKLYHKLQDAYPKVNIVLERIKYSDNSIFLPFILKYFDFSDLVYDTESLETKMLSSFWKIKNQNFMSIATYNLDITHSLEFDIACNYIIHISALIKERCETQEIYHEATALNYLYNSLCTIAYKYLDTYDKSIADSYIQISHILPVHKYLFACNRQQIMKHLHNTKNVDDIFIDHFFLAISGKNSLSLTDIKVLSMNVSKKLKSCNVYNWLLRFVADERLYDNSFVFFVKFLRSDECKILAKLVKIKCKYKTSLLAKCKCRSDSIVGNKTEENGVNDVEDIDCIDKDKMNDKGQQEGIEETNIDDEEKEIVLL